MDLGMTSLSIDNFDKVSRSEILLTQFWNSSNGLILFTRQTVLSDIADPNPVVLVVEVKGHTDLAVKHTTATERTRPSNLNVLPLAT